MIRLFEPAGTVVGLDDHCIRACIVSTPEDARHAFEIALYPAVLCVALPYANLCTTLKAACDFYNNWKAPVTNNESWTHGDGGM